MPARRVRRVIWTTVFLMAPAWFLFTQAAAETHEDAVSVETAQRVLQPFKRQLMTALQDGLAKGPQAAIDACQLEAPRIATEIASDSIRVGRTSHRLRNPANAPKPWMLPILQELRDAAPGVHPHRTVRIDAEWIGYAEGIYMKPLCLTCHGTDLPQSLSDRIHAAYPEDEATGFAAGEFRGIFWVELKTAADTPGAP